MNTLQLDYFSLRLDTIQTATIIQARHKKSIDHLVKVILAQILPQSANNSNRQHSLFACSITMMTNIELFT